MYIGMKRFVFVLIELINLKSCDFTNFSFIGYRRNLHVEEKVNKFLS